MKKISTIILAALGTVSIASAQSNKSIAFNDHKISNGYDQHGAFGNNNTIAFKDGYFIYKEKEAKLAKINREFDQKIALVKSNRHLNNRKKAKQIKLLQSQRKNEISKVELQYAKSIQKAKSYGHDSHKW